MQPRRVAISCAAAYVALLLLVLWRPRTIDWLGGGWIDAARAQVPGAGLQLLSFPGDLWPVVATVAGITAWGLATQRRRLAFIAIPVVLTHGTAWVFKWLVGRLRPDGDPYAFPSGHASVTMVLYLYLAWNLGGRYRWWLLAVPAVVGVGRLLILKHWPSDVLAGWALGAAVAALAVEAVRRWVPADGLKGTHASEDS